MSDDDVLFGFRLRLFSLAGGIGVRPACRAMGVHHSTYYRWKRRVDRWGLEALRVRERRRPRMPNELGPHLEQRIIACSLAHPGFGPGRVAAELAREKRGELRISPNGVWRLLRRHGLNTRTKRLSLIAGYAARHEPRPCTPEPERHIEATRPGELAGLDCFYIGRLSGTKDALWQYTAIDIASGYARAGPHSSPRNPRAEHCQALVKRVAAELDSAGRQLDAVLTDNGSEYLANSFTNTLATLPVQQRRIRAGRPQTNGHAERLQQTIPEERWRPSFARSLVPKQTALKRDLNHYLTYHNHDRAHTGRPTKNRIPDNTVHSANKMKPR